jgi:hypothetical protein
LFRVNSPADDLSAARIKDCRAENLSIPRGLFRNIGYPNFVQVEAMELPADEIIGGGPALQVFPTRRTWKATDSSFRHQHRDQSA